jgi:hypothetical protein
LQNVLPLVATDPSKALPIIEAQVPRLDSTLGIARDLSGRVTQTFERPGQTPGTAIMLNPQGRLSIRAMEGASRAAFEARPPEFPQGSQLGAVELKRIPIIRNGEIVAYEERENLIPELAPGVENIIQQRQTAESIGETFGQETEVWDPVQRRMVRVSRAEALGYNRPPAGQRQPAQGQQGQPSGVAGFGGVQAGISPEEESMMRGRSVLFEDRIKNIGEKSADAGRRSFQANQLYDTVSRLDPTAFTAAAASIVPYIRAIPGMRQATDQFATDAALFGQQYARGVLGNFANVKGNLNAQEVRLVEDANWQRWDPRTATRYVAVLEAAFADKDAAEREFANQFTDDPRNRISDFDKQWRESQLNFNVFNHPMMDRFVTDEITESLLRDPDAQPNLPPGFKAEKGTESGRVRVTKPDGSVMFIGQ